MCRSLLEDENTEDINTSSRVAVTTDSSSTFTTTTTTAATTTSETGADSFYFMTLQPFKVSFSL